VPKIIEIGGYVLKVYSSQKNELAKTAVLAVGRLGFRSKGLYTSHFIY